MKEFRIIIYLKNGATSEITVQSRDLFKAKEEVDKVFSFKNRILGKRIYTTADGVSLNLIPIRNINIIRIEEVTE